MKKIFIIADDSIIRSVGGAITSTINICNMLAECYQVSLLFYSTIKPERAVKLRNVNLVNLREQYHFQKFDLALSSYIEKNRPDLLIFTFPDLYCLANKGKIVRSVPKILLFRSRPDIYFWLNTELELELEYLYANTVSQILFDSFHCLLPPYIAKYPCITIPNYVDKAQDVADLLVEKKKIIYLSRVDSYKGIEFLINAFLQLPSRFNDWTLDIYGQSQPEVYREKLEKFVKDKESSFQINFMGISDNPRKTFLDYDFCVFPSYFEGFPNGLAEALSCGLPAIGLAECTGVNELIVHNYNGFLSYFDEKEFMSYIVKLIEDKNLRIQLGKNATVSVEKYSYGAIRKTWINTVHEIMENGISSIPNNYSDGTVNFAFSIVSINKIYKQYSLKISFFEKVSCIIRGKGLLYFLQMVYAKFSKMLSGS